MCSATMRLLHSWSVQVSFGERSEDLQDQRLQLRPAVGPSYGLFVGRSAEPLDNPAQPHWPLPTVHATQAQNQTEDLHEPTSFFIENSQTFPQPKPVAKLQLTL